MSRPKLVKIYNPALGVTSDVTESAVRGFIAVGWQLAALDEPTPGPAPVEPTPTPEPVAPPEAASEPVSEPLVAEIAPALVELPTHEPLVSAIEEPEEPTSAPDGSSPVTFV